ncbi:MAG: chemotaxis protein CheC [Defluviitaleaceae bacterium]|nr:chemotaxis protein CheC [Defluviitaleaceae bacterium]MCL2263717.1 chemotaxis protein CheC [Defluviitaleaceae bacterium]
MSAKSTSVENLFSDMHLDILKELGSMGTAHAATALSKMVNKKVTMPVPRVAWMDFQDVANFVGGPENIIVGILVSLSGNIQGMMMSLMELESAHRIVELVIGTPPPEDTLQFGEMERSVVEEVGNIMLSSYLSSLAGLTNSQIKPSIPYMCVDMANAILSVPASEFGRMADKMLFIESKIDVENIQFSGCFVLVPNLHSFFRILRGLGAE